MHLYRTRNFADPVHTGSSRPSTFYPGTAFCSLGICCAFTGLCPAYTASLLDKYCLEDDSCVCHLYVTKGTSTILGPLLKKAAKFTIGSFHFQFSSREAFEHYADYSAYDVTYEGMTLTFLLVLVDTAIDCSPRASLNFVVFIWHNIKTFAFIKYAIVCTPLETLKMLFLRHYRSASDGWRTALCFDRNRWWCNICDGPLFILAQCLVDGVEQ